jgi:hypothetical protein
MTKENRQPSDKQAPAVTIWLQMGVGLGYMVSSSFLTTVNKSLYEKYNFSSPLNLFLVQCVCNVFLCMAMMTYKTYVDPKAFGFLTNYGIRITTLDETYAKCKNGFIIGGLNIVTVLFGLFSVKHVSIPLFLLFRRCAVVATIIVTFIIEGTLPDRPLLLTAALVIAGAVTAGYESFDDSSFGFLLIWGNNFAQSVYNVVASKYNADKKITAFEINFFFALMGLPLSAFLTV